MWTRKLSIQLNLAHEPETSSPRVLLHMPSYSLFCVKFMATGQRVSGDKKFSVIIQ